VDHRVGAPDDLLQETDRRSRSDWIVLQLEAIFAKRAQRKADKGTPRGAWLEPARSAPSSPPPIPQPFR
jgi:hypothetical protein